MFEDAIGRRSEKVENAVERGAVRKFAEAIGDPHPIFVDREFGQNSKYGDNIAPPTFPRVFDYGVIESLQLPIAGLIHGEQEFEYKRPLLVGESLYCYTEIEKYAEKKAQSGKLGFLTIRNAGDDEMGNEIFSSKTVVIITEAVRGGM
ncbi:MAG TPA: MaoC family dehydratase N-terminal domain-containing protein [Bacillales bacterium]|nr:MaoC family dehydratase N-terminal domain-containing protein [Bacillales bacterium]